jgi:hypothetical protein
MMFLHTKPCSSARLCMVNVKTMGQALRSSGAQSPPLGRAFCAVQNWCGPGPVRETNNGPGTEGYQTVGYPKLTEMAERNETRSRKPRHFGLRFLNTN